MQANTARYKNAKIIERINKINVNIYNDKITLTILNDNEGGVNSLLLFRKRLDRKSRGVNFGN